MINERLKEVRLKCGVSQNSFAKYFMLKQQTYQKYESGLVSIPQELMTQLAEKYGINLHWLITGYGPMYLRDLHDERIEKLHEDLDYKPVTVPDPRYLLGHRLREIRRRMGTEPKDFCKNFGLNEDEYIRYENQEVLMPVRLSDKIQRIGVNLDWLHFGTGNMFYSDPNRSNLAVNPDNETLSEINERLSLLADYPVLVEDPDNIPVRMTSLKVSAGHGIDWSEGNLTGEVTMIPKRVARKYPGNSDFAAAVVSGDSMEPTLHDGEPTVFIKRYIQGDGIYVLAVHGELLVKRLEFNRILNKLRIISDNPKYPPTEIRMEDLGEVEILGKVVIWVHGEI